MDAFSSSFLSQKLPTPKKADRSLIARSSPNIHMSNVPLIRKENSQINEPKPLPVNRQLKSQPSLSQQQQKTREPVVDSSSFPNNFFNVIDHYINTVIDPPKRPFVNPEYVLSGNFAPVDELPPTKCEVVEGSLPPCLDGAYIRNGPNSQFFPRGPHHWLEGDGMLHSIRIHRGEATFCSRLVKTYKYLMEKNAGSPVIPGFFSGYHGLKAAVARLVLAAARMLAGQYDPRNGIGVANTSLALIGGKLYALCETDLPYAIKIDSRGDIITLGRHDFHGKLRKLMTAHPKIDPDTNEAFAYKYGAIPPFLTLFRINPGGEKEPDVPIFSKPRPTLVHDFAITKRYSIFPEVQIAANPLKVLAGGSPVSSDPAIVPRLGVIPRYAKDGSEMKWFDVPGLNLVHAINAWDEDDGDTIVLIGPNMLSVEHFLERIDLVHASLEKVRIDLKTGTVRRCPLSARNLDMAVINPAYVGKQNRYAYAAIGNPVPKISGLVKLDISATNGGDRRDCVVASRHYGAGCYGGEPFFVAKETNDPNADEDDGYVVSYVHDETKGESRFLVMDAKSPDLEIVAAVKLPRRVPYGFHGLFVKESDLNKL